MVPPHTEHIVLERRGNQNQPHDCAHLEAQEGDKRETQREEVEVGRRPPSAIRKLKRLGHHTWHHIPILSGAWMYDLTGDRTWSFC